MACLTRHGIFVRLLGGNARAVVHLWIVAHHALVHSVEGKTLSVGTPERAFVDAELIAVDTLSIDNLPTAVGGQLMRAALSILNKEVAFLDIGVGT